MIVTVLFPFKKSGTTAPEQPRIPEKKPVCDLFL